MPEVNKVKLTLFLVGSTLLITFVFYGYQICYTPNILVDREAKIFVVRPGATFRQVQEDLGRQNIVNDMVSFSFLARLAGYDKAITPGRFAFKPNTNNLQAIGILKNLHPEVVKVTFSYARLRPELVEKITKYVGMSSREFNDALDDFVAANKEGFNQDNILCLFIPNTYEVYFNMSAADLVEKMHAEYKKFWTPARLQAAEAAGLTPLEVSILASIVQAESVKQDEAPIIAGLYINRLKKDIALQADPTLVYALGDFTIKRVLNSHKQIKSPYNTYKYPGLPPGPINLPQIWSIDAVLHYKHHDYYYMCAKEDFSGYHNFAHNLEDHNKNAHRYQMALNKEMEKAEQNKK